MQNLQLPILPKGAVKTIETYIIKSKKQQTGKIESENVISVKKDSTSVQLQESREETKVAKDPYRWRYIFYILLLVIGVSAFFYLRNKFSIVNWIKKIFK